LKEVKWYKYETNDGIYYTWKPRSGQKWFHTDGSKEAVELANSLSSSAHIYLGHVVKDDNFKEHKEATSDFPSGAYRIIQAHYGDDAPDRFVPLDIRDDKYTRIESLVNPIINDLSLFVGNESLYRNIGAHYKRGILLYGPPGEGKSALIRDLLRNELRDAVTFFLDGVPSAEFVRAINLGLKGRLKVFIFEEILSAVDRNFDKLLRFLDGEISSDNAIIFATTNYPEKLPQNIVDRPSRFDKIYKIGDPDPTQRAALLKHYLMREPNEAEVEQTRGLSTAAIKEVCLLFHLQNLQIPDAAKKLRDHTQLVKNDFAEPRSLGIHRDDD